MTPMMTAMEELDRGWSWVVLVATFGYFMIFGMFLYGVGVVHMTLLEEYGGKSATTAWAGGLFSALASLGGPLSSIIIDKFSCRTAMFLDGILTTIGCLSTAFSPSLSLSIVTYGIIAGLGGGLGYTATMVVVSLNFRKWRILATGIAVSGVGFGTFVLSPIMEVIREFYGSSGYFIILAGIGLNKCVFASLCEPSRVELLRQNTLTRDTNNSMATRNILRHYAKVYSNKAIICFSFSLLLFGAGTYMIFLHLPVYSVSNGSTPKDVMWLLSCCGLCTVMSRIFMSIATNKPKADDVVLYLASFGSLAVGTFLFPLYSKAYVGQLLFTMFLGVYFGGCYAIMNSINVKVVGSEYVSIATGMELFFCGVGTAVGPVITGMIVDGEGTYEHAFMVASLLILLGAAMGMAAVLFKPSDEQPDLANLDYLISKDECANTDKEQCLDTLHCDKQNTSQSEDTTASRDHIVPQTSHMIRQPPQLLVNDSPIIKHERQLEPANFTEEIEKLLNGVQLKFIDEEEDEES